MPVEFPLDQSEISFTASGGTLVRRTILSSGVRVLSEFMPGSQSTTVGAWVAVGSRDEEKAGARVKASLGSTHFLEHLLFKGTKTRSALDIAVAFDSVGGEHNANTAKEYTCYFARIRSGDLPMAVAVLLDMFTSSVIAVDEFETERSVILEELGMAADDPSDVANERLFEAVLGEHPLGRPIGGNPATIRAANRDTVWEHYRANYQPSDLVVTAAGAVDHDELCRFVADGMVQGGWQLDRVAIPVPRRSTKVAQLAAPAPLTVVNRPTEQVNLFLGSFGLVASDERRWSMSVLNTILGSGMSSRLFQEVRERRGLAYSVYSFAPSYSDAGLFAMYAGCAPGNAAAVVTLFRQELDRLSTDGITANELHRAVGQISGTSALALEDSDTRMSRLGRTELGLGEFYDLDNSLSRIAEVTRDGVQALAADLAARPTALVAVGPITESVFL